jgi:hypothetical protein
MGVMAIIHVTVLLVLALAALGLGVSLAISPREARLAILGPISTATVCAAVGACATGIGTAFRVLADQPEPASAAALQHAAGGFAEAMVPVAFGLSVLAVAWGLAAVGLRRQP